MLLCLGKYFRRETFTYCFLVLLPLILVTELWLYCWGKHKLYGEILDIFCILLWPLAFSISTILALIQMISCFIYLAQWRKLTSEQRTRLGETAQSQKKTGRILQSEDVILYYGMFSKKVLLKYDVVSMQSNKTTNHVHVRRGSIDFEIDSILVRLKSGKSVELMCNINVMDGYDGELPWKSIGTVVLFGASLLIMKFYPILIRCFMKRNNMFESILLYIKYDWVFWSISAVLITAFGILLLRIKKKYVSEVDKGVVMKPSLFLCLLPFLVIFCYFMIDSRYDDSVLAKSDLKSYWEGEYEETIVNIQEVSLEAEN